MDGQTKIIAVAGKGGVGKTSLSAVIVKLLVENFPDKKILAIDADPAIGLSTALGVEPTKTIDDVRKETAEQTQNGKTQRGHNRHTRPHSQKLENGLRNVFVQRHLRHHRGYARRA